MQRFDSFGALRFLIITGQDQDECKIAEPLIELRSVIKG